MSSQFSSLIPNLLTSALVVLTFVLSVAYEILCYGGTPTTPGAWPWMAWLLYFGKANALKQSLEYIDLFLGKTSYYAASYLAIADFSILASVTQLEEMECKINHEVVFLQFVPGKVPSNEKLI